MSRWDRKGDVLRALLLWLPSLLPIIGHLYFGSRSDAQEATGFIQYDQAYYMANARQYLDGATDALFYASPFSSEESAPPIYFQPQIALLSAVWAMTGWDPGVVFNLFGLAFGALFVWLSLRMLRTVIGDASPFWLQLIFIWGGGVLFSAGMAYGMLSGESFDASWHAAFRFDPANGYWFLNWGRNLVFPLEAYYHILFMLMVLFAVRGRWLRAVLIVAVLALSHPFTGAAALTMLLTWVLIERLIVRSWIVPGWVVPALAALLVGHFLHHALLLPRNAEHAQLVEQWSLPWLLPRESWLGGYAPVLCMALFRLRSWERLKAAWAAPTSRLLIVWVVVWSALEHHELFMRPIQPLHFTRGYVWAGLFLLGAPALAEVVRGQHRFARPLVVIVLVTMLSDNVAWLVHEAAANAEGRGEALLISKEDRGVLEALEERVEPNALLVCEDPLLAYMALVYTPHRAYCSHHSNTPFAERRFAACAAYFAGRVTDPLLNRPLIAVSSAADRFAFASQGTLLYKVGAQAIYRMPDRR